MGENTFDLFLVRQGTGGEEHNITVGGRGDDRRRWKGGLEELQ